MRWIMWKEPVGRAECPYAYMFMFNFYFFTIRVHHWIGSDDPRYMHNHAWWFITWVVKGGYTDITEQGKEHLKRWSIRYRPAHHKHTVQVDPGGAWTVLITGRSLRKWGFYVTKPNGTTKFVKSNKFFLEHEQHPCQK